MATSNGTVSWGIVPGNFYSSSLGSMSFDNISQGLISANGQLRYQVQWDKPNTGEGVEPNKSSATTNASGVTLTADIVSVIFKVECTVDGGTNYKLLGSVKKSRDIPNRKYSNGSLAGLHRFTIDVSQLLSDELSYSLCPINKGTWQSNSYGGMNGGIEMQDNVIGANATFGQNVISDYNVSDNGTWRGVKVTATFELIDAEGKVITATNILTEPPIIHVINSVNQFEEDNGYYFSNFNIGGLTGYDFLTRCPNSNGGGVIQDLNKPVRMDEQAEWLQFFLSRGDSINISTSAANPNKVCAMGIEINTYIGNTLENTFYLNDFQQNLKQDTYSSQGIVAAVQNEVSIQNISPYYINNTAALKAPQSPIARAPSIAQNWNSYTGTKITDSTTRYTANLVKVGLYHPYQLQKVSETYNYSIDRESLNIPYGFVRFHWLNSVGGIDSYTAKRDVVEGLTISRDVIERKSADRTWYQANSGAINSSEVNVTSYTNGNDSYISDTMRGGNLYKGGREVLGINAERVLSVYTEPLNKSTAKWLKEIMLSPNVWIEMDSDATAKGNTSNPYLRPSTKGYIPVIITNSEIETVNQAEGLVKFNIEYTLSHKVQTQRN